MQQQSLKTNNCPNDLRHSPVVDDVGHDGDEQTKQHDCCAGIHHRMQVIPRVWWEG